MALGNPFDMYMQAAEAKNRNRRQSYQDIASLGQSLGQGFNTIGQTIEEQKKKALLNQIVKAMQQKGQPIPGPQGYTPPGSTNAVPAGQPIKNDNQIQSLMMQYDPQSAISRMPTPLQQSEIAKNNAMAQKYQGGAGASKPVGTIYRNMADGTMTDDPNVATGPEWKAYKTTQGDVLNKLAGQTSSREKNKAYESRAEAMQRGIDVRQIDQLAKSVGITPAQRNLLQQNNMRASRTVELASRPMTWQEFNNVLTDAAAIMQGGVPHVDQIHSMTYPAWQEQFARWRTYATSQPTTNVPPEIRNRVIEMVQGIQKIDNRYLAKNAEFEQQMIGPTIRGGIGRFKKPISEMTQTITGVGGEPSKGARGQETATATGPNGQKIKWNGSQWVPL